MTHLYKNNFETHHFLGVLPKLIAQQKSAGPQAWLRHNYPDVYTALSAFDTLVTHYYKLLRHCSPRPSVVFKFNDLWLEDKDLRSKDVDKNL